LKYKTGKQPTIKKKKDSRGRDWKDHLDSTSTNKLSMVVHNCDPSYMGGIERKMAI
jgi:hypothetical protein